MADPIYGLSKEGVRRTAETNRRVLGSMPDTGRRTRRVFPPSRGGGGSEIIAFQIVTADCATREGTATVLAVMCQNPSVEIGDTVDIIDFVGCSFGGDDSVLIGLKGYAVKMARDENWPGEGEGCQWHILRLCCPTEMC